MSKPFVWTMDLFEQIAQNAKARPNDIALQTIYARGTESISFRDLLDAARAASETIRAALEPGEHVALLLPNDHHFGIALLAAASAGAVVVPLDPVQDAERVARVVAHAECRLLICGRAPEFAELGRLIRRELPDLQILESPFPDPGEVTATWPLERRDPDDDFLLMYTGGTTGAPKGVRLTVTGIVTTFRDTIAVFPLSPRDRILSILPLFHIMAIQANLLAPVYAGARVCYLQSRDPQVIAGSFREYGITAFLCVPLFYYQLHRRIFGEVARQRWMRRTAFRTMFRVSGWVRRKLGWNAGRLLFRPIHGRFGPQLRGFGVGGARFSPEIAADLHDLGFAFFQGYGLTETSGLASISPMSLSGGFSSGPLLKNLEIRIDAPGADGRGEILLRGVNIMRGYWKDEAATDAALGGGWFRTGDIGHLTGGQLHVVARKKEVIVLSSGKNIFPEPLETWFQTNCPLIQEICIFGYCPNGTGAERLHALIVPDQGKLQELAIANVREELRYRIENANGRLPDHEKLRGFDVRFEPLPRTSSRKLQRFRIMQEFRAAEASAAAGYDLAEAGNESESARLVKEMVARIKPGRKIRSSMNLELDLSFDSLERVELLSNVGETFGLRIASQKAAEILTVGDIAALVANHQPLEKQWAEWGEILREPLSETERALAERYLGPRPIATPLFFAATRLFCLVARLFLRYRVSGVVAGKSRMPLIVCPNHQSYLDLPLICGSLPYGVFRRLFTMSSSRFLRSYFQTWFGRTARSIPIDPDRHLRSALRLGFEGLRRGMVLCVFPEGHRSTDEEMLPFHMGAAILAVESAAETVPAGIDGTGRVWGRGGKGVHLRPVRLGFGAPLVPIPGEDYSEFNRRLFASVRELKHCHRQ